MTESPRSRNALAIAGFGVAIVGIVGLYLRHEIFARQWPLKVVQGFAVLLMIWARLTFGMRSFNPGASPTAGALVTTGPYRFWRHPIYAAIIIFVAAAAISYGSWITVALALVVAAGLFVRMREEEKSLSATYPEYAAYAASTARVIPGVF